MPRPPDFRPALSGVGPLRRWGLHGAHLIALGFGSGLSPIAPGTVGTLWAWLFWWAASASLSSAAWGWVLALSLPLGVWCCAVTARSLAQADPSCVVWDEVIAFWLVLWLITPTSWVEQVLAFALFRGFDAVKPGPVGWADGLSDRIDFGNDRHAWLKAGAVIVFDDLIAAGCTLFVMAVARQVG